LGEQLRNPTVATGDNAQTLPSLPGTRNTGRTDAEWNIGIGYKDWPRNVRAEEVLDSDFTERMGSESITLEPAKKRGLQ